jgi:hypothetical protein
MASFRFHLGEKAHEILFNIFSSVLLPGEVEFTREIRIALLEHLQKFVDDTHSTPTLDEIVFVYVNVFHVIRHRADHIPPPCINKSTLRLLKKLFAIYGFTFSCTHPQPRRFVLAPDVRVTVEQEEEEAADAPSTPFPSPCQSPSLDSPPSPPCAVSSVRDRSPPASPTHLQQLLPLSSSPPDPPAPQPPQMRSSSFAPVSFAPPDHSVLSPSPTSARDESQVAEFLTRIRASASTDDDLSSYSSMTESESSEEESEDDEMRRRTRKRKRGRPSKHDEKRGRLTLTDERRAEILKCMPEDGGWITSEDLRRALNWPFPSQSINNWLSSMVHHRILEKKKEAGVVKFCKGISKLRKECVLQYVPGDGQWVSLQELRQKLNIFPCELIETWLICLCSDGTLRCQVTNGCRMYCQGEGNL